MQKRAFSYEKVPFQVPVLCSFDWISILHFVLDPIQLVGEAELDILLFSVMVMRPKNEVTLQN